MWLSSSHPYKMVSSSKGPQVFNVYGSPSSSGKRVRVYVGRKPKSLVCGYKVEPSVWRMASKHELTSFHKKQRTRGPLPAVTKVNASQCSGLTSRSATPALRSDPGSEPAFSLAFKGGTQSVISSEETGSECSPELFTFPTVCLQ